MYPNKYIVNIRIATKSSYPPKFTTGNTEFECCILGPIEKIS